MINCPFCDLRHRENGFRQQGMTCGQVFAKNKSGEEMIAGKTKATQFDRTVEADIPMKEIRILIGAAAFAKKRKNPPLNWRQLEIVELVRVFLPDEYTKEELDQARAKARRMLSKVHGRFGFLPSLWRSQKQTRLKQATKAS